MKPEELKKQFETIQNTFAQFKDANDEALKTQGAEINRKVDEMAEDIAKHVEEYNTKISVLEALANQPANKDEQKEKNEKEIKKHFNEFVRSGQKLSFNQYLKANNIELNALSVDSDPDGGSLVLPQYESIRKTREFESSPVRRLADVLTIGTDRVIIPVDYDEASASWAGERATRTATDTPQIGQIEIPVHELYALQNITKKMLEDAGLDVQGWAIGKINDKFIRTENTAYVSGNGVGQPLGFLSYDAWTTAGTFEHGKIEQVNSGAAASFTADGILDLQNSLIEVYQGNAVFMTNRASFKHIMKLKDGQSNYLFNRDLSKNVGSPFDLLNRPVEFANDMPAVDSNALALAYGDFRAGYQIVDRKGIDILLDPYSNKPYVQIYATRRTGGAVVNFEAIKLQKLSA